MINYTTTYFIIAEDFIFNTILTLYYIFNTMLHVTYNNTTYIYNDFMNAEDCWAVDANARGGITRSERRP